MDKTFLEKQRAQEMQKNIDIREMRQREELQKKGILEMESPERGDSGKDMTGDARALKERELIDGSFKKLETNRHTGLEKIPENVRMKSAVDSIKDIEGLKPEKWGSLDPTERRVALEHAGKALNNAYDCGEPPVYVKDFPEYKKGVLLGSYEDGADIKHPNGDYDISMNEKLIAEEDPRKALGTYCHEFRHGYQHEMASRYAKPQFENLVHDKDKAAEWHANIENYQEGPPPEMKPDDPEFKELAKKYEEQIVERDARNFSEMIVKGVYG